MSWQCPTDKCELNCAHNGSESCLRNLLTDQGIAPRYLSLGVLQGVKHLYHPHDLPPCIHGNGNINWHHAEKDLAD